MVKAEYQKRTTYIPSLDGMRGLLCVLILMNHWKLTLPISPVGWQVLQYFFVMSGFLITRILLLEKEKTPELGKYTKSFYTKRSLRIFPLYFFYLFMMVGFRMIFQGSEFIQTNTAEIAESWMFYFTYTSNIKGLFIENALDTPFFSHLWSMAIEEQFYLIMPMIVYFLRGKALRYAMIAFLIFPTIARIVAWNHLIQDNNLVWTILVVYRNLPFQTDSFALGAIIAIFNLDFIKHPKRWFYFLGTIYVGICVYLYRFMDDYAIRLAEDLVHHGYEHAKFNPESVSLLTYIKLLGHPLLMPMKNSFFYTLPLFNVMAFFSVLAAVRGDTLWKPVLMNKYMVKMGRVTYGMYVYHYALIVVFLKFTGMILKPLGLKGNVWLDVPQFLIFLFLLYWISKWSYEIVEKPFLKLKNKIK